MSNSVAEPTCRTPSRRGFTFIELMVVISIIVALAALGFPVWSMVSTRTKVNATDALVNNVATAITNYQLKTWQWNIGTDVAPIIRMYHIFDLNHYGPASDAGDPKPDLENAPNGVNTHFSIDGYMPPLSPDTGVLGAERYGFSAGGSTAAAFTSAPTSTNPEQEMNPSPWDVNFHLKVLQSGYRGFIEMAQPQIKKSFINKRGQVIDAWGRPLRIAYAARVYGTQGFGVWSAGRDKKDHIDPSPTPSDDLRSWKTQGSE